MKDWTDEDKQAAAKQGWALDTLWDLTKQRVEAEVAKCRDRSAFPTDKDARQFVARAAAAGDALAAKALRIEFHSRVGVK